MAGRVPGPDEAVVSPLRPGAGAAPPVHELPPKVITWLAPDEHGVSHSLARMARAADTSDSWGKVVTHCGLVMSPRTVKDPKRGCPRCYDVREDA